VARKQGTNLKTAFVGFNILQRAKAVEGDHGDTGTGRFNCRATQLHTINTRRQKAGENSSKGLLALHLVRHAAPRGIGLRVPAIGNMASRDHMPEY
jgi:hypothetical protein